MGSDHTAKGGYAHRPTLGTFRLALALMVFWAHIIPRPFQFLYVDIHGYIAVLMFFALSGFLISNAMETIYKGRVRDFLINRCLRIYPSFWASFALVLALCSTFGDITGFGSATISIKNYPATTLIEAPFSINVLMLTWSLHCEWMFYITIAAVYLMFGGTRYERWVLYGCCFAALIFYAYISAAYDLPWSHPYLHIPYFVVGVAVSRLLMRSDPLPASLALLAASIGMSVICFGHLPDIGSVPNPGDPRRLFAPLVFWNDPLNLYNFGWMFLLFLIGAVVNVGSGTVRRIDDFLGDITYPLYISHYTVIAVVGSTLGFLPDMPRVWIAFAAALGFAVVLWFAVDRNVIRWRDLVRGLALHVRSSVRLHTFSGEPQPASLSASQ